MLQNLCSARQQGSTAQKGLSLPSVPQRRFGAPKKLAFAFAQGTRAG